MITNDKEILAAVDIASVVGDHVSLKQRGKQLVGLCPFHQEKTPSFYVHPDKGFYKCHGCGKGGDAASFLKEIKGLTYPEAIRQLAKTAKLQIEETEDERTPEERDLHERLLAANEAVIGALHQPGQPITVDGRTWDADTVDRFLISLHPADIPATSAPEEDLIGSGWLRQGKTGPYPFFRERLLFPITTHNGRICGVTARRIGEGKEPKYLNSPETPVYKKDRLLFGFYQHRAEIREAGECILVEGATDVISLSQGGIRTAVAALGTALSSFQARAIRQQTGFVLTLYDGDDAGRTAALRNLPTLLQEDLLVDVCFMEEGQDPDSFVRQHDGRALMAYIDVQRQDALIWAVTHDLDKDDTRSVSNCTRRAIDLLSLVNDEIRLKKYIRQLATAKVLGAGITKELASAVEARRADRKRKTTAVEVEDDETGWGLITQGNMFRIQTDSGDYAISNFIVKPVMLVIGSQTSERIVEIVNFKGRSTTLAINSDKMVSLDSFKQEVERQGNFIFYGSPKDYTKVRAHIYEGCAECHPITMLGQHREGFWAWSNGLSHNGQFHPVNEYGVVEFNGSHFYLPAWSKIGEDILADDQPDDFETLRQFSYFTDPRTSVSEWSRDMVKVYGPSSHVAIPWLMASLFYDLIFKRFRFFPLLNLFGPPGSGKTYMATSLMAVFGKPRKPFGLAQGSDAGFFRSLSQYKNAVVWFDEYSNNIKPHRSDAIKNTYDGTDRVIGQKSNDNKTRTQKVSCPIVLSGQEQPTFDIAMFERTISLSFAVEEHSRDQLRTAQALKDREGTGAYSQVAAQILAHRAEVEARFADAFEECRKAFTDIIERQWPGGVRRPKERFIANYLIPITMHYLLADRLNLAISIPEVMDAMLSLLIDQAVNIYAEDDASRFWGIFLYCAEHAHILTADDDFIVQIGPSFKIKESSGQRRTVQAQVGAEEFILFIRMEKLYPEYAKRHREMYSRPGLNKQSLIHYLRTTDAYIGSTQMSVGKGPKQYLAFRLQDLDFDMSVTNANDEEKERYARQKEANGGASQEDLPF